MSEHSPSRATPPAKFLPVLERLKNAYVLWHQYHSTLPKIVRYSIGNRVDTLCIECIEAMVQATFISRSEKEPWIRLAVRKLDTLKVLLMILWETKSLDTKKYVVLSEKLDEVGKMLGGWSGQVRKQNSPTAGEK